MVGIRQNKEFSINFPSFDLVTEVDHIGTTSGKHIDKSTVFKVFYGETRAPIIKECPLTIELVLEEVIELPDHYLVIGNAVNSYIKEDCLTQGIPDLQKMNLMTYTGIQNKQSYWSIGERQAEAFKIGKEYKI
jgi:flavin reductase (DIM6/NTAB) family NADH-FMN oxidoreductase RutF